MCRTQAVRAVGVDGIAQTARGDRSALPERIAEVLIHLVRRRARTAHRRRDVRRARGVVVFLAKLKEIAERLGVRYVVNLARCPAR
jgi:hypothetical protein